MSSARGALAVTLAARILSAALGLAAVPLYLKFLGVEAYGITGLFVSLQALVTFLDFGLGTTLTRQLAISGRDPQSIARGRDVAATFERAYLGMAVVLGAVLTLSAWFFAAAWVNSQSIPPAEMALAMQLAAITLAVGWPSNLYGAGLLGMNRQVSLAVSTSAFAIMRVVLAVALLNFWPTLTAFFIAQLIVAAMQTAGFRVQFWRALGPAHHRARVRWQLLRDARAFAGGMTLIAITSILLVHTDKLVLSYLLPLRDFGVYAVASTLATGLYVMIGSMFAVIYPRISQAWAEGREQPLAEMYHASGQAMAALVLPLAIVIAWFSAESLFVLSGDRELSAQGRWPLVFLVLGTALNGVMNVPYALQLAAGWTSLTVRLNAAAVLVLVPLTWFAALRFGGVGGAVAWLLLNAGYLLITPQVMHQRLLPGEKWRWYAGSVASPVIACVCVTALAGLLHDPSPSRWVTAAQLFGYWLAASAAGLLSLPLVRAYLRRVRSAGA